MKCRAIVLGVLIANGISAAQVTIPTTIPATTPVSVPMSVIPAIATTAPATAPAASTQPVIQVVVPPTPAPSVIASYTATIAVGISLLTVIVTAWYYRRLLRHQDVKDQIDHIQSLLDSFYGPLRVLKQSNRHLNDMLKLRELNGVVEQEHYSLLERLLNEQPFSTNQLILIKAIISNNTTIQGLISHNCGAIENEALLEKLQRFCAHQQVIEAAFKGEITGEFWRFKEFVYPAGLDETIKSEMARLQGMIHQLRTVSRPKHASSPWCNSSFRSRGVTDR